MRIAALYDIHGNAPALEAVLAEVEQAKVDALVIGGDILAGPLPNECLALLRGLDLPICWLWGNGESDVLAVIEGEEVQGLGPKSAEIAKWITTQLTADEKQFLQSWTMTQPFDLETVGPVLFCHATPQNNVDVFTKLTPDDEARAIIGATDANIIVCGHTHMQFDRQLGDVRVVNAGSVGMPFGETGAYWLLIDDALRLKKTTYDLAAAAERIRQSNYPEAAQFAEGNVLRAPSEEDALAFMMQIAARQAENRHHHQN